MRIRILSDVHLDVRPFTPRPCESDLVLVAGDLSNYAPAGRARSNQLLRALVRTQDQRTPVCMVAGNHDYYAFGTDMVEIEKVLRRDASYEGAHFLDRDHYDLGDLRVLGCTLWSSFTLLSQSNYLGKPITVEQAMSAANRSVNDFYHQWRDGRLITPQQHVEMHFRDRDWLSREITRAGEEKKRVVVLTHFCPHPSCVHPQFAGSLLNPYFASDCSELFRRPVVAWVHGHTHCAVRSSCNGIPIYCNPRGYCSGDKKENRDFDDRLVIEV